MTTERRPTLRNNPLASAMSGASDRVHSPISKRIDPDQADTPKTPTFDNRPRSAQVQGTFSPELATLCPQPLRAFHGHVAAPLDPPGSPWSTGTDDCCQELRELLSRGDKGISERPLSSVSTTSGPTPSPDDRAGSPFQWTSPPLQGQKVFVGGIPQDMTQDDLLAVFNKFSPVKKAWLQRYKQQIPEASMPHPNHRGFGFVIFYDAAAVDHLLGPNFSSYIKLEDGRRLEVKRALSSNDIGAPVDERPKADPPRQRREQKHPVPPKQTQTPMQPMQQALPPPNSMASMQFVTMPYLGHQQIACASPVPSNSWQSVQWAPLTQQTPVFIAPMSEASYGQQLSYMLPVAPLGSNEPTAWAQNCGTTGQMIAVPEWSRNMQVAPTSSTVEQSAVFFATPSGMVGPEQPSEAYKKSLASMLLSAMPDHYAE